MGNFSVTFSAASPPEDGPSPKNNTAQPISGYPVCGWKKKRNVAVNFISSTHLPTAVGFPRFTTVATSIKTRNGYRDAGVTNLTHCLPIPITVGFIDGGPHQ